MFRSLAARLGNGQPFWAFQARDLEDHEVNDITIERLAAQYSKEIQSVQPHGPYFLGGLSFGALVAFEISRMLREQNQDVALLVMFDAPLLRMASFLRFPGTMLRALGSSIGRQLGRGRKEHLTYLQKIKGNIWHSLQFRWRGLFNRKSNNVQEAASRREVSPQELKIIAANLRAFQKYRPRPYSGAATFFAAQSNSGVASAICEAEWRDLTKGGVEIHVTPGTHGDFFEEPYVEALAKTLEECLQRANPAPRPNATPSA